MTPGHGLTEVRSLHVAARDEVRGVAVLLQLLQQQPARERVPLLGLEVVLELLRVEVHLFCDGSISPFGSVPFNRVPLSRVTF